MVSKYRFVHFFISVEFDTDFEDGWGTFSNNFQYQTQWKIVSGPSKINVTGALSDHTFGNGLYSGSLLSFCNASCVLELFIGDGV